MLSQKLTKEILILNFIADSTNNEKEIDQANEIIKLCTFNHNALEKGNDSLGFPKEKSKELSELFVAIKPNFEQILKAATRFLDNKKLRSQQNFVKIVMLSMYESEEYVLKSIRAGADGYLLKDSSKEEFLKAVYAVSKGRKYFSGDISSILIRQISNPVAALESKQSLEQNPMITKREKEILKLLLSGKGNKEIAASLAISKRTAGVHRFNLMKKMKVKNIMELSNKANEFYYSNLFIKSSLVV